MFYGLSGGQHRDATECFVVDKFGDGRLVAAEGAVGVAADFDGAEGHIQSVNEQQPTGEGFADAQYELGGLGCLNAADHTGEHTENASLGAARHFTRRRRSGEEAAVAALSRHVHGRLPIEQQDTAVHEWLIAEVGGVVDEVAGGEVVRAVDDDVVFRE